MNPNYTLPPLSPLKARSTAALLLTIITGIAQLFGVNIFGFLESLGLGGDQENVLIKVDAIVAVINTLISHGNEIILILAPIWLWIERKAPQTRISLRALFKRS